MKFLKGLALSLLSLLLFLSLTIFGVAFTLNRTILNPDFLASELNRLDISSLTEELLGEEILKINLPEQLETSLVDTIPKLEPLIKEQLSAATYSIYDYMLGKRQELDLVQTLKNTVFSQDFVASLVDEIDISALAMALFNERFAEKIPEELLDYLAEHLEEAINRVEPLLKEQASTAVPPVIDYLLGESPSLKVVISLEPVIESLRDTLREAFIESPPPALADIPSNLRALLFDEFFGSLVANVIPLTFELNESLLGTEVPASVAETIADTETVLEQARQYISYFQLGYGALLGFMVLLVLLIILIHRQVKGTTRQLGITALTYGASEYAGIFITKYYAGAQLPLPDIPPSLQTWLPQFLNNLLAPLEMLSLGLLIGGVVLIGVSFVYRRG